MEQPKQFLSAQWQHLAMINFEVDPAIVQPYLPLFTEPDTYNGKTLVSMVGFMFADTKVFGIRWPFHTNFEEVNLRLYVRHPYNGGYRRGVVFVSEIVPRIVIATLANYLYHEHYTAMPMRHNVQVAGDSISAKYEWKKNNRWSHIFVEADASLSNILPGSEEEFIFEHYWGYNQYNSTTTLEYGVEHITWQVHKVKNWSLQCDAKTLYGNAFAGVLSGQPSSVFLAKGSEVVIRKPRFIRSFNG